MRRATAILVVLALLAGCSTARELMQQANPFRGRGGAASGGRLAVLPFAYRGEDGGRACDLCPDRLIMAKTSAEDARLVTAFIYDELTRHPSISVVPYEELGPTEGRTMSEMLSDLTARVDLDAVLVGALLELRPRLGDPRDPYQRAGAALYAVLIDMPSGRAVRKRVFDRTPGRPGRVVSQYHKVVRGEPPKSLSAQEVAQRGAARMVSQLISAVR